MFAVQAFDINSREAPDHTLFIKPGAGDDKLFVTFYMHYIHNEDETAKQGRPIFNDAPFIRIITPGDRDNIIDRPVRAEDRPRFPRQWAQFEAQMKGGPEGEVGTPLEQWGMVTKAMVEELRYFGFRTVEHVAGAKDEVLAKMPGLRGIAEKAKLYLEAAKGAAPLTDLQKKNEEQAAQILAMQEQMKELLARLPKAKGE
jgi:hypothetical protein